MKRLELISFYADIGPERVGFILRDETIVEVDNIAPNPENGFSVRADDIIRYEDEAIATWHTHPNSLANLSAEDYVGFRNYPLLRHYIVGKDGIRCFVVVNDTVVEDEDSYSPRVP